MSRTVPAPLAAAAVSLAAAFALLVAALPAPAQPAPGATVDAVAPSVALESARFRLLSKSARTYALRARFAARDDVAANAVDYRVTVTAGGIALASATGTTTAGAASVSLRFRLAPDVRAVRLAITASDPLGNERRFALRIRLGS